MTLSISLSIKTRKTYFRSGPVRFLIIEKLSRSSFPWYRFFLSCIHSTSVGLFARKVWKRNGKSAKGGNIDKRSKDSEAEQDRRGERVRDEFAGFSHCKPQSGVTYLNEAWSSWRRVSGRFSWVGVFCGVPGALPGPFFFNALFNGTAWNFGSFAGISSTLDVSMFGSACEYLYTRKLSSSSSGSISSSSAKDKAKNRQSARIGFSSYTKQ